MKIHDIPLMRRFFIAGTEGTKGPETSVAV
jgi:hypothetical protein